MGLSNGAQASVMLAAVALIAGGTYVAQSSGNPVYALLGGAVAAAAVAVKEALGGQSPPSS